MGHYIAMFHVAYHIPKKKFLYLLLPITRANQRYRSQKRFGPVELLRILVKFQQNWSWKVHKLRFEKAGTLTVINDWIKDTIAHRRSPWLTALVASTASCRRMDHIFSAFFRMFTLQAFPLFPLVKFSIAFTHVHIAKVCNWWFLWRVDFVPGDFNASSSLIHFPSVVYASRESAARDGRSLY